MFRETLIRNILGKLKQKQLILIEAQAGQGKSILAAQIVSRLNGPCGWYQIGPEDADPVSFERALVACLMHCIPGFSCPVLADMIEKGEINASEHSVYIDILRTDLGRHLKKDCFLVFDDVYLLEMHPVSQSILYEFLRSAPNRLHFILTSRRPMLQGRNQEMPSQGVLRLRNEDIRLSEEEIFILFNDILGTPISLTEARELWRVTEGWIMGLVMVRAMITKGPIDLNCQSLNLLHEAEAESLAEYFRREVFTRAIDSETRSALCKLSLLTTMPLALAERLTGNKEAAALLTSLAERNYFVRFLNDEGTEFAFHHLCREALRLIANDDLPPMERQRVYQMAGDYYSARKLPEEALAYYVKAGDYLTIDKLLDQEGLKLYSLNRLTFLESVLCQIPDDVIIAYGWLSFFQGMVLMQQYPPTSIKYLQRSLCIFSDRHNDFGRLHAMTKILHFRLYVDARYGLAFSLLEELEKEFNDLKSKLDALHIINISHTLSAGFAFIKGDLSVSRKYSDMALLHASELKMENTLAEIHSARSWGCFSDLRLWYREVETSHHLKRSIAVNSMNKMLLHLCSINLLEMDGDFENYFHQELQLTAAIENNLMARTFTNPFLFVWSIDIAIARGEYSRALDLVLQALQFASPPHLSSQYFHYLAFLQAVSGDLEGAKISAEKSLALRGEVGGKIFVTFNQMIIGGAYAILGYRDKAEELLALSITNSKEIGEEYLRAGAHAAFAYLLLHQGEGELAAGHVKECLRCLRANAYRHFFGWSPTIMRPVLEYAVTHDIDVKYAQKISRERLGNAILSDGVSIPLMKIETLGYFTLSLNEQIVKAEDLTPAMRELLALIISSPDMKMYQEEILATLWPDIPAAKARGRFDTLLLELRKTLKAVFGNNQLDDYLILKKGMLCLTNCHLDADLFVEHARNGLMHVRKKEYWQAGNRFYSASLQWKGAYLTGLRSKDRVSTRGHELDHLYSEISLTWGNILFDTGLHVECIDVLNQSLKYDQTNDVAISALYQAYVHSNQPIRANELLKQYENALHAANYDPEEIREALKDIWSITGLKQNSI